MVYLRRTCSVSTRCAIINDFFRRDNITSLQFPVLALSDAARRVSTILGISVQTDVLRFYKMCT